MGIFSSTKKEKIIAIFDIGSGSIGGAIVRIPIQAQSIPTILASVRTDFVFRKDLDFDVFFNDMIRALDTTARLLHKKGAGAPEEIFCVLASPWYISQTRVVRMTKETPFLFSRRIADDLLKRELTALVDVYNKKYEGTGSTPLMIEHHVIGVKLNGYTVDDPIGKKTKSLEMDVVISLSPKQCVEKIRETIDSIYPGIKGSFASFMTSSYLAVRDHFVSPESYLLVDVGSEVTDVAVVSGGVLRSSLSFPFGKNTIFKYICTKQNIELRDAQELFSLYCTGTLAPAKKQAHEALFESIKHSWSGAFYQSVTDLKYSLGLPATVFLTADADSILWFAQVLESESYIQSLLLSHRSNVISLSGSQFINVCNVRDGSCDPFLMIEAIAFTKRQNS
jgi:hypothetical protein